MSKISARDMKKSCRTGQFCVPTPLGMTVNQAPFCALACALFLLSHAKGENNFLLTQVLPVSTLEKTRHLL